MGNCSGQKPQKKNDQMQKAVQQKPQAGQGKQENAPQYPVQQAFAYPQDEDIKPVNQLQQYAENYKKILASRNSEVAKKWDEFQNLLVRLEVQSKKVEEINARAQCKIQQNQDGSNNQKKNSDNLTKEQLLEQINTGINDVQGIVQEAQLLQQIKQQIIQLKEDKVVQNYRNDLFAKVKDEKANNISSVIQFLEDEMFMFYPKCRAVCESKWKKFGDLYLKLIQNDQEAIQTFYKQKLPGLTSYVTEY